MTGSRRKIVLATRNPDKVREIQHYLADLAFDILSINDFDGIPEIEEDGATIEANAIKKARIVAEKTGLMTLADDTGLEVAHLQGAPGVFSSRFAGENATYADNVKKLLAVLAGVPASQRLARFRTIMALARNGSMQTVEGICTGIITETPRGDQGFGYDPIFWLPEHELTFAEMDLTLKNQVSHRAQALKKVRELLKNIES